MTEVEALNQAETEWKCFGTFAADTVIALRAYGWTLSGVIDYFEPTD